MQLFFVHIFKWFERFRDPCEGLVCIPRAAVNCIKFRYSCMLVNF